jgi:threonine dehydrogenase-like Zn-dependent dehydrogenase
VTIEALTYLGAGSLAWQEAPAPRLASDVAALVRPVAVATCDLDALIVAGVAPFPAPFPLGHECVAEVVEVGDGVTVVKPGDRVSVPFQISCGSCAACLRGRTANCTTVPPMSTYGFGPAVGRWGGFLSDLVEIPFSDHMLVPVPADLASAAIASASDNIADAWRAVGPQLTDEPGADVLIVAGYRPGSIPLYAVSIAVALGAGSVTYVDSDPGHRSLAVTLGALAPEPPFPRRLGPFPITVDGSASAEGIALALRSTAPDGVCTSVAIYFADPPPLPLLEMYTKGVTFRTGRVNARPVIPHVLDLAQRGQIKPELVTTRVVAWGDAPSALLERDWTKLVIER